MKQSVIFQKKTCKNVDGKLMQIVFFKFANKFRASLAPVEEEKIEDYEITLMIKRLLVIIIFSNFILKCK